MTRLRRTIAVLAAGSLAAISLNVVTGSTAAAAPFGYAQLNSIQKRLASGLLTSELGGAQSAARQAAPAGAYKSATVTCTDHFGNNVKVNQNCLNITDPDLQGR